MNKYEELKQQLGEEKKKLATEFFKKAKVGNFATIGNQLYVVASRWNGRMYLAPVSVSMYGVIPCTRIVEVTPEIIPEVTLLDPYYHVGDRLAALVKGESREEEEIPL